MKTTGEEKETLQLTLGQQVRYRPTGEVGTVEAVEENPTAEDYKVWVSLDGGETQEKVSATDLALDYATEPT
ncbi:MAG TPA: hypothetical protein VMB21_19695 [Candidatus Limnocylindria bacterium]|nr:hypothetical protein [Candidatus Limnocylindria bacterium]